MKTYIGWIFKWIKSFFFDTFVKTVGNIKLVKRSPLASIVALTILAVRITGIAVFMIVFVSFIVDGGYQRQLESISAFDLDGALVMDSVNQLTMSVVLLCCIFPLAIAFLAIIVAFILRTCLHKKNMI